GVVRQVDDRFVKQAPPARPNAPRAPQEAVEDPMARRDLDAERAVLEADRRAVEADRRAVEADRRALDAERAAWEAERSIRAAAPRGASFAGVLAERGLSGADECERAVRALAEARRVPELLPFLEVTDRVGVLRWL